jgi:hypothetical protein
MHHRWFVTRQAKPRLRTAFAFAMLLMFLASCVATDSSSPNEGVKIAPLIEFQLQDLGYHVEPEVHYHGTGTRDVSILYDKFQEKISVYQRPSSSYLFQPFACVP